MSSAIPVVLGQDEGDFVWFGAGLLTFKVTSEQSGGVFMLTDDTMGRGKTTPLHVHPRHDETVYVIDGQLTAIVDGEARTLLPGERYILIGTPDVFEQFLAEGDRELQKGDAVGPPAPADIERLTIAAPRFGITLMRDWPARTQMAS